MQLPVSIQGRILFSGRAMADFGFRICSGKGMKRNETCGRGIGHKHMRTVSL